jgi:signal transduction histidine kinase
MPREQNEVPVVLRDLRELERLFAKRARRGEARARRRAKQRALATLESCGVEADRSVLTVFAAEMFGALRVELAAHPEEASRLARDAVNVAGVTPLAVARHVLRDPELLALSPGVAVEVQLAMLLAFAPLRSASLWTVDATGRTRCVRHVGQGSASRRTRELAQRLLVGDGAKASDRTLMEGVLVERWQQPVAALVGRPQPGRRDSCRPFLEEAVPALSPILERDALMTRNAAFERALAGASERRLTRLGFDLHDGPLQELVVLAQDLRLFREQLGSVLSSHSEGAPLMGRVDDLEARLVALDGELRGISTSLDSASILERPFASAVRHLADGFVAYTDVEPRLTLRGEFESLTKSQRIALLRIVQEALSNIREHSDASEVAIDVCRSATGVEAKVVDNGRGFDVEATLMRAAQRGRLGLVGVHERVRLLGGHCRIESRSGGPTVVSVMLPPWEPLAVEASDNGSVAAGRG